jgi:hypothetical protein
MMNNFSLFTADRMTHLKIVVVAVVLGAVIASLGGAARVGDRFVAASDRIEATVVKAGKPVTASAASDRLIR